MKAKMSVKIGVDLAMTIALLLLMAYQLIGEEAHEWIGIVMFVLFVLHHFLNSTWSRNLFRGKYNARRICQTGLVVLILLCMLGSMVSGIVLSRYIFALLGISGDLEFAGSIHILCAYWGLLLMGLHLGFHWNMMMALAKKWAGAASSGKKIAMRALALLLAIYGAVAFGKRGIWDYLTLKNHFAFYDFSEPVFFFLLDYLAVMALFVVLGHYLSKGISGGFSFKRSQKN